MVLRTELGVGERAIDGAAETHMRVVGGITATFYPQGSNIGHARHCHGRGLPVVAAGLDALLEIPEPGLGRNLGLVEVETSVHSPSARYRREPDSSRKRAIQAPELVSVSFRSPRCRSRLSLYQ
jgi:hypothetical protein